MPHAPAIPARPSFALSAGDDPPVLGKPAGERAALATKAGRRDGHLSQSPWRWPLLWSLWVCGLAGCFESTLTVEFKQGLGDMPSAGSKVDSEDFELPFNAIEPPGEATPGQTLLVLSRLEPESGPASGGNTVLVTGSGFEPGSQVFFGRAAVNPALQEILSGNEIRVSVPAGEIGEVDVSVRNPSGTTVVREGGYLYHALTLSPTEGARAGGTLVEILVTGEPVDESVSVWFGEQRCSNQALLSPGRLRCEAPPGSIGAVDVSLRPAEGEAPAGWVAPDGFRYVDPTASVSGGLGGGPIDGTVNVTLVDGITQRGLPGIHVVLGHGQEMQVEGVSDERGQLVLSAPDLKGPIDLHVIADCIERTSIRALDSRDVTLFIGPLDEPRCVPEADAMLDGGGGVTRGDSVPSMVSGELIFPGSMEFGANTWDVVPRPRDTEVRVTYVYATHRYLFGSTLSPTAIPAAKHRIVEDLAVVGKRGGYEYSIATRSAGLAVYALSGVERADTHEFIPYVMGVARNLVTSPGAELSDVDIHMDIPLDRKQQVTMARIPPPTRAGPYEFRVRLALDLGAEGLIRREVTAAELDVQRANTVTDPFDFFGQPAFVGPLVDARYAVVAGWYSGPGYGDLPYTEAIHLGVEPSVEPEVVDDLLGIPVPVEPHDGGPLPADRTVRWKAEGAQADFYIVDIWTQDNVRQWRHIVPGDVFDVTVPDFTGFEGVMDLPTGFCRWVVRGVRIPGFDFGYFNYSHLEFERWTHDSLDEFLFIR